jgi:hypothetical protein
MTGVRPLRHYSSMKAILCSPLFFTSCALADETTGRAAIARTIAALNESTVTISHEPWREATINVPARVILKSIRYVTPDVALADATRTSTPLLFVMKKESDNWAIASVYVLASPIKVSKE